MIPLRRGTVFLLLCLASIRCFANVWAPRIQSLEFEIQTLRDDLYSLTNRDTLRSSKMRRLRSPQHDGVVNQAQSMAFATPEVVLGSPEALSGAHDSSNGDVIAQGILSENQGRQLFEMYGPSRSLIYYNLTEKVFCTMQCFATNL